MLLEIKEAIVSKLRSSINGRARVIADDSEGEAGSANQVRGDYIIRVGYAGGNFSPPTTVEDILQSVDRTFQVSVEIRDLRTEDKAVQLLEDVEKLLIGFHPCVEGVTGKISGSSDRFQQNKDGIYYYIFNFTVPTIFIEN